MCMDIHMYIRIPPRRNITLTGIECKWEKHITLIVNSHIHVRRPQYQCSTLYAGMTEQYPGRRLIWTRVPDYIQGTRSAMYYYIVVNILTTTCP